MIRKKVNLCERFKISYLYRMRFVFCSKYCYNILFFIVVHESPISHFKGFSIEGTHCNNSMWERFLIAAQGLLRGQRQDSSQCPLGSYDKKEGFLCDLKFLICNVCDSFISNVLKYFYNILSFIVAYESLISYFKGFLIEGSYCMFSIQFSF